MENRFSFDYQHYDSPELSLIHISSYRSCLFSSSTIGAPGASDRFAARMVELPKKQER